MLFILMGYCMLHLTTEITGIDFANDFHIHSGERFVVTSGDLQLEIGSHGSHGYHILFKNNGHIISDLHGVKAEDFNFNMKDRSLNASFLIDPMAPFHELDVNNHPNFSIAMHAEGVCNNCVHGNLSRLPIVSQAQSVLSSIAPEAAPVSAPEAAPVSAPVSAPEAAPVSAPEAAPVSAPVSAPEAAPVSAPEAAPVSAPVSAPEAAPVSAPEAAPVSAPVSAPEAAPVSAPEAAPVSAPVSAPEAAPVSAPEAAPVSAPVSAPEAAPVSAPVSAPKAQSTQKAREFFDIDAIAEWF
uniref:Immunodominant surface protein TRP36 n=1 Tax=Ehrlichia minasensis TaxID=1242993 RepID=A0A5P8NFF7_9RICK|nr:immunodominant surface protein TRP36 [Ehrlichia minasensis]